MTVKTGLSMITLLEPSWDGHTHFPANLGLLRTVLAAFPDIAINYVGGQAQIDLILAASTKELLNRVTFYAWTPNLDRDTLPSDLLKSIGKLRKLPRSVLGDARRIVMSSCTSTMLSAISFLGMAGKTCAVLHGNANEINAWNSRNPLRNWLNLSSSLRRYCTHGGTAVVIEQRIQHQLSVQFPWLKDHLVCIPHALVEEESASSVEGKSLTMPIHIGFAGNASIAKGFPDFLEFANQLTTKCPDAFVFHAIGMLPEECRELDQSVLFTRANAGLQRADYVHGLKGLHYIFTWHQDSYYANAASGVVYDAINLGIPLIARGRVQLTEWQGLGYDIAHTFNEVSTAVDTVANFAPHSEAQRYRNQCKDLGRLRESLSTPHLAKIFRERFPI